MTLKDKIHKIKESRLSPAENFLYSIFWNIKPYVSDKYTDFIFCKKDNEILFQYNKKNRYFWCHYDKIWKVLESKHGLNYQEISNLIKGIVWVSLKLKEVTPGYTFESLYIKEN